ncbi:hypothetical protein LTR12_009505 [Friedmanniomyces endolithicus]|nr:hypothetical protein LTR12_009505 [Friedmanniomyces endolithicus]
MSNTALPHELRTYLATCSPEHAEQIIQALREAVNRNATEAPLAIVAANSMVVQTGSGVAKNVKKQRNKKPKIEVVSGGPKRPLNSWMAFRKYYNASLSPLTQKAISKVLMSWWREDPFSAKWAILAKAYSVLRGSREKDEAPLDFFLGLVVPLMGIVSPENYPAMMGWQIAAPSDSDQDKTPTVIRLFTPKFSTFEDKYISTTLSVDDLVQYCMRSGYLNDSNTKASAGNAHGALTMAVQPTVTAVLFHPQPATLNITAANDATITGPLSPFSLNLARQLGVALDPTVTVSATTTAANTAATTMMNNGFQTYGLFFDPTNEINFSLNPAGETAGLADGGMYDAYDPAVSMSVEDAGDLEWTWCLNDDALA